MPGLCSGTSYVTSLNVVRHVTSVFPSVPFFYLEDMYVSLCIQQLGDPFHLQKLKGFLHGGGKSVHSAESGNNLSAPGQASAIEGDMESQVSQGRLNKGCVNHGNRWKTAILTSLFFFLFSFSFLF